MFICSIAVSLTEQNSVLEKIRRNGFLFSIGIAINRLVPAWLFRFSRVVFYEMDPEKFEVETGKSAEQHEASIQVSWCETEDELRAVEKLTYTSAERNSPVRCGRSKTPSPNTTLELATAWNLDSTGCSQRW